MSADRRDGLELADTQHPNPSSPKWDGGERRTTRPALECPIAEEAHREVRHLHQLMHGDGHNRGVFEQMRELNKSSDGLAQTVFHLETRVGSFDHKLDETLRAVREEVRLANEQVLLAKQAGARQVPLWLMSGGLAGLFSVGVFFAVRLWKELFGR